MSEPTDAEREQQIRAEMAGRDPNGRSRFLLRLLDAERTRADAAEAKVSRCNCQREGYDAYGRNIKDRLAFLASEPE